VSAAWSHAVASRRTAAAAARRSCIFDFAPLLKKCQVGWSFGRSLEATTRQIGVYPA
jgi:hypothetical protein